MTRSFIISRKASQLINTKEDITKQEKEEVGEQSSLLSVCEKGKVVTCLT
jgi:hypothetical protein